MFIVQSLRQEAHNSMDNIVSLVCENLDNSFNWLKSKIETNVARNCLTKSMSGMPERGAFGTTSLKKCRIEFLKQSQAQLIRQSRRF